MSQGQKTSDNAKITAPHGSGIHLLCTRKSPYCNETGVTPYALPNGYFEAGNETLIKLATTKILVIGAGGLGCELLKDLALVGFKNIHVIDMDTIDVTNLNRQFLFREKDVGRMKSDVAAEFITQRDPTITVTPYTCKIQDKDDEFYKQFGLIVAGLDNIKARQWMNAKLHELCPVDEDGDIDDDATLIPMIDGGTEGLSGQVHVIIPRVTKCFNCTMKDVKQTDTVQVCTIANEPRTPSHCIIFVKFAIEQRLSSESALTIVEQWKKLTVTTEDESHNSGGKSTLIPIDNDSPIHMQFICEKAQERARQYDIDPPDYNKTMGVIKNIIPAIASTNAIIAAGCANEAFKLVTFASQTMCDYHFYLGSDGASSSTFQWKRDKECMICNQCDCNVQVKSNSTLRELRKIVADKMEVVEESITMNPYLDADDLPDGAPAQLLWSKGPLAELTKGNLDLTLTQLKFDGYEGAFYLGASADMNADRGGVSVNFQVVVTMEN